MNPENQNRVSGEQEIDQLKQLLRQAMPTVPANQLEPRTDLWAQLRARIESRQLVDRAASTDRALATIRIHVHWFDWALAALATAALVFFPGIIPALLYHF